MCLVSDKLKLCTCKSQQYSALKHYWVLYTYVESKEIYTLGEVVIPASFGTLDYFKNKQVLLARLNETDAFDISMSFRQKDVLEVVINNQTSDDSTYFSYYFQFNKGTWLETDLNVFDIENDFDLKQFGKIKGALLR